MILNYVIVLKNKQTNEFKDLKLKKKPGVTSLELWKAEQIPVGCFS